MTLLTGGLLFLLLAASVWILGPPRAQQSPGNKTSLPINVQGSESTGNALNASQCTLRLDHWSSLVNAVVRLRPVESNHASSRRPLLHARRHRFFRVHVLLFNMLNWFPRINLVFTWHGRLETSSRSDDCCARAAPIPYTHASLLFYRVSDVRTI